MGAGCSQGKEKRDNQNQQQQQQQNQAQQPDRVQQPQGNRQQQRNQNGQQHQQNRHLSQQPQPQQIQQSQQQQPLQRGHTGFMPPSFPAQKGNMPVSKTLVHYNKVMVRQQTLKLGEQNQDGYPIEFKYDSLIPSAYTLYFFINIKIQFFHELVLDIQPHKQFNQNKIPEIFKITQQQVSNDLNYLSKSRLNLSQIPKEALKHKIGDSGLQYWPFVIKIESGEPRQTMFYFCEFSNSGDKFSIQYKQQRLEMDSQSYVIQEIYGIDNTQLVQQGQPMDQQQQLANEDNTNKECIICFTDLIDTVIMPCRHMCICMECAKSVQQQKQKSKKNCPICRKPIESFLRIKKDANNMQQQQQKQQIV